MAAWLGAVSKSRWLDAQFLPVCLQVLSALLANADNSADKSKHCLCQTSCCLSVHACLPSCLPVLQCARLDLQKRYAGDEDFQLTPAQARELMALQAAELEDTDIPPVKVPSPLAALQATAPTDSASGHESPALQTSASLPAAAAAARAAEPSAARESATLAHSVSMPLDNAAQIAPSNVPAAPAIAASDTKAADAQGSAAAAPSDTAKAADKSPTLLKRVPYSPKQRSSSELHSAPSDDTSPAAATAAAGSPEISQKSRSKVWLPPMALSSPRRVSGRAECIPLHGIA